MLRSFSQLFNNHLAENTDICGKCDWNAVKASRSGGEGVGRKLRLKLCILENTRFYPVPIYFKFFS